ncbi:E3 ubiquitin-protein ligase UHRF1-like isoform X2 [Pomacea canaliculata]|uniref:E3 ubiquitin-protein ligase UHRF1-like isoform X2 n=1 Tax=Pomacea canaliculata TaxID=400727 RepID=UPI000D7306BC|nr:E3 ubiquitin-protein ligase UHRF1-like isoform X2 [Pomacea canaliculata]
MWIQVRTIDGKKTVRVDSLSKLTKIEELRKRLVTLFDAQPSEQRLFYRGKQLEDGHTLFDYDVGLNDLIQLMIRIKASEPICASTSAASPSTGESSDESNSSDKENKEPARDLEAKQLSSSPSWYESTEDQGSLYKVGDIIDARDVTMGAWFEAEILEVVKEESETSNSQNQTDGFIYKIQFETYEDDVVEMKSKDIRPRARHILKFEDVKEGQLIMANYNYDDPNVRGFWYDCLISRKRNTRTTKELYATLYIGSDLMPLENCRLLFISELFDIEKPGTQLTKKDLMLDPSASPAKRQNKPECDHCQDNPRRKCKHCACCVCGGKNEPEKQVMCDECDQAYHLECLNPPLTAVPQEDEWYCPECKNDENEVVKAGEKLKESKKKAKMASSKNNTSRDWGKGMACVGRTKECTIVPSNHYGPVPGVEVGTMWKFRVQVSEAGVHRPHVAGIHGREDDGAFSIVLSGGYEDDADNGDEFYYTGSGGRDLSGNKRTAEQSCDQKLTRMNRALAKNCNAPINDKTGAEAKDWKGGKPVRVVRNCKGRKHSKYAPEEGNRYDGIYKIVKYWAEKGKSGFLVWRYLLRRDDPAPAPWTKEGQKRAKELGLAMQYPDGYLESQAAKEKEAVGEAEEIKNEDSAPKTKGRKRKAKASPNKKENVKKSKTQPFEVNADIMTLIKADSVNEKLWGSVLDKVAEGKQKFLQRLEEIFSCICCQEILYKPVTLQCTHNFCKSCISRSFKAEVYSCPACRSDLPKDMAMPINQNLAKVLAHFYPGYEAGRV